MARSSRSVCSDLVIIVTCHARTSLFLCPCCGQVLVIALACVPSCAWIFVCLTALLILQMFRRSRPVSLLLLVIRCSLLLLSSLCTTITVMLPVLCPHLSPSSFLNGGTTENISSWVISSFTSSSAPWSRCSHAVKLCTTIVVEIDSLCFIIDTGALSSKRLTTQIVADGHAHAHIQVERSASEHD